MPTIYLYIYLLPFLQLPSCIFFSAAFCHEYDRRFVLQDLTEIAFIQRFLLCKQETYTIGE